MLLLLALIVGSVNGAWAADGDPSWSYTVVTGDASKLNTTAKTFTIDEDHVWSYEGTTVAAGSPTVSTGTASKTFGLKFGASGSNYFSPVVLSTNAFDEKAVTKVRLHLKHNGGKVGTLTVKQGAITIGTSTTSSTSDWIDVACSETNKGVGGTLTVKYEVAQALYINKIEVWYEDISITKHTLSSLVTPSGVGTVTLGATEVGEGLTTTITATATDGNYRFKNWSVSGTEASVESATENPTTFTMGTDNATVTANFEIIPTHTLNYEVSPVGTGSVTLSATSVKEAATATATVAANAGYKFTGWSITGSGASLSSTSDNPTTVTMGTEDATLTANFVAVTTYPVHWSVNGNIIKTDNVEENTAITFDEPAIGVPTGYSFCGWVEEANRISGTTNTDPKSNYVTSANATAERTYYAVMAIGNTTSGTATLTASHTVAATSYDDHSYTDDQGNEWTAYNNEQCASGGADARYGLNGTGKFFKSPVFPGYVTSIKMKGYNGSSSENRYFNINTTEEDAEGDLGTILVVASEKLSNELTATLTGVQFNQFYLYAPKALSFSYITVAYEATTYKNYCTTIPDESVTVTSAGLATYVSDYDLDYTGKSISAYIAKEEGGKIKMTQVYKVPAGTGVLLRAVGGATVDIPVTTEATDDVTGNLFKRGSDEAVANGSNPYNYILNNIGGTVGFYRANMQTVAKNRAYLQTTIDAPATGRLSIFFDDEAGEATGIIEVKDVKAADAIFNLNGVRVKNMTKGLYIVNGKKVIVK